MLCDAQDGPSAGVTLAVALASLCSGRPARRDTMEAQSTCCCTTIILCTRSGGFRAVTLGVALAILYSVRPARSDTAITGELTLRSRTSAEYWSFLTANNCSLMFAGRSFRWCHIGSGARKLIHRAPCTRRHRHDGGADAAGSGAARGRRERQVAGRTPGRCAFVRWGCCLG